MLLKDTFTVEAPRGAVWEVLQDIHRIAACVPGVEGVEEIEPDVYHGLLTVRVGPISSAFDGRVRFLERSAPQRMVAEVEGQDKATATLVRATFTGVLTPDGGATQIAYEMDLALRGRLAQFGLAVVQATAKKLTAEFARCLQAQVGAMEREND